MYITAYLYLNLDEKSYKYAVTVAKLLCASHEENMDIMFKWDLGSIPKIDNILKPNEYLKKKLNSIWQKAICRRPCTFHLAILTEILYLAYFIQCFVFFGTPCIVEETSLME